METISKMFAYSDLPGHGKGVEADCGSESTHCSLTSHHRNTVLVDRFLTPAKTIPNVLCLINSRVLTTDANQG